MRQIDLIKIYVDGSKTHGAAGHCGFMGTTFVNYSTILCEIDRETMTACLNVRKYSPTTSKIQTYLRDALTAAGFRIFEVMGDYANMWNAGYMGAPNLKASDFRPIGK